MRCLLPLLLAAIGAAVPVLCDDGFNIFLESPTPDSHIMSTSMTIVGHVDGVNGTGFATAVVTAGVATHTAGHGRQRRSMALTVSPSLRPLCVNCNVSFAAPWRCATAPFVRV